MADKRVVITGIGIASSIGLGRKRFWNNLLAGTAGIKPISIFKPFDRNYSLAGEIKDLDFKKYLGDKGLRCLDRCTKILLIASKLALEDSKLNLDKIKKTETGVVVGTDWGHAESNMHFHTKILIKGPNQVNPMDFPGILANSATSQVSIRYGLTGCNTTIARGYTSGLDAIGYAVNMIKEYDLKMIFAGGVENLSVELYAIICKTGCLARLKSGIKNAYKPFDEKNDGIVFGEGAGVLILEDFNFARKRGANILAEVIGYGFSFGDNQQAMKRSIDLALEDAGVTPGRIDYICANTNGNLKKDKDEIKTIIEIFGHKDIPLVSSIKFATTECLGATPAMQAAASCLSLSKGLIPPTVNFNQSDKIAKKEKINMSNQKIRKKINIAMVNSFGLDGNNACLILKKGEQR